MINMMDGFGYTDGRMNRWVIFYKLNGLHELNNDDIYHNRNHKYTLHGVRYSASCTSYSTAWLGVQNVHYSEDCKLYSVQWALYKSKVRVLFSIVDCTFADQSPKLKTEYHNETQYQKHGFMNTNIFVKKYCFMWFVLHTFLFSDFLN